MLYRERSFCECGCGGVGDSGKVVNLEQLPCQGLPQADTVDDLVRAYHRLTQ